MVGPFQRHLRRESLEDKLPELSTAIDLLKNEAELVNARMIQMAIKHSGPALMLAQNTLATLYFRQNMTWGVDTIAVRRCRDTVSHLHQEGHSGLVYVILVRLLQENIELSNCELEIMASARSDFAAKVDHYFKSYPSCLGGRQVFMPRELVRIPAFAQALSDDGRLDYLGRSVCQIKYDADVSVTWPQDALLHKDILGRTPLHQAIQRRDIRTVRLFLESRVDLSQRSLNKLSVLHIAACQGHTKMVELLVRHAPNLASTLDATGRTPFWYAARGCHLGVMKLFSTRPDINVDQKDDYGLSPAAVAARDGRYELLRSLLRMKSERVKAGIALAVERSIDHTPLLLASQSLHKDCVEVILQYKSWEFGDNDYEVTLAAAHHMRLHQLINTLQTLFMRSKSLRKSFAAAGQYLFEPAEVDTSRIGLRKKPIHYPYIFDPRALTLPTSNTGSTEMQVDLGKDS